MSDNNQESVDSYLTFQILNFGFSLANIKTNNS